MKFTADRNALLRAMTRINSIVDAKSPVPIVSNTKISAGEKGGSAFFTGTDLSMEIICRCDAKISTPGETTVPCRVLHDILRKLPDDAAVEIDAADTAVALRSGRSRFKLSSLPVIDFPEMKVGELPVNFQIDAGELLRLIDRTCFAVSTEETRPYLNGIYLHQVQQEGVPVLRAVATDGHRLARADVPLPPGAAGMDGVILPRKLLGELARMLDGAGPAATAQVSVSTTQVRIEIGDVLVTSKLIDGTFPDYDRVIPSVFSDAVEFCSPGDLIEAVQRVSVISDLKSRRVAMSASGGVMTVSSSSTDGQSTDELDIDYRGAGAKIGFNSAYLLDVAGQFKGSDLPLRMSVVNAEAPAVFTSEADTSILYVLMPMRG